MRTLIVLLVLISAAVGGAAYYSKHMTNGSVATYRTVTVQRGELVSTISATGTLEPEELVDVGAQVAGLIVSFGKDANGHQVDYNSVVEKDSLLALIDPTSYEAARAQAQAALDKSEADLEVLQAKAEQTEGDWKRAESLRPKNAIADTDYDSALSEYKQAKANVAVGKATIEQNKAALKVAETNLRYTKIVSPVRGTIIDRRVNIGQTVVASLSAPSLFLIAKDLTRMQVWASVNESDIGQIKVGMPVTFTVDAHPGEQFAGKVAQVRMNATMTQNVVTYMVIIATDNPDGKLLPYLTASVLFEVNRRPDVLLVSNSALRWQPKPAQIAPGAASGNTARAGDADHGTLWVADANGLVRPLAVTVGVDDRINTEVSGPEVHEGLKVVVGDDGVAAVGGNGPSGAADGGTATDEEDVSNPFLPKPPKGHRPPPPPG